VRRTHRLGKVAVGGTFDELHRGHRILLAKAFEVGEIVMIGLTSDEMLEKYPKGHAVDCYESRKRQLLCFLSSQSVAERARIIPLHDSYGTTLTNEGLEALIVSEETKRVAGEINRLRRKLSLKPLRIFVIAMVEAEDAKPISSTRIRKGEINREGRLITKQATSTSEKPRQPATS
jgi:cytidyltransferase-like protein